MVDNVYPVGPNFPNGLLLQLLIEQLSDVWPSDVFPVIPTLNGPANRIVVAGSLMLDTARALTVPENDDALVLFQIHNPATDPRSPGITVSQLPTLGIDAASAIFFVRDLPRLGVGDGTLAYWDGFAWRRVGDDRLVSTL